MNEYLDFAKKNCRIEFQHFGREELADEVCVEPECQECSEILSEYEEENLGGLCFKCYDLADSGDPDPSRGKL